MEVPKEDPELGAVTEETITVSVETNGETGKTGKHRRQPSDGVEVLMNKFDMSLREKEGLVVVPEESAVAEGVPVHDAPSRSSMRAIISCTIIGAVLCVLPFVCSAWVDLGPGMRLLERHVASDGMWGPVVATAVLAVCTAVAIIPLSLVEVLCGYLLRDIWVALAVCVVGKVLGACFCFALSRTVARSWAERIVAQTQSESFDRMRQSIKRHPFLTTVLSRFAYIPAAVKNYGWPVLGISFRVFFFSVLIEAPFFALPMVLIGARATSLVHIQSGEGLGGWESTALIIISLLALFAFGFVLRKL